MSSGGVVPDNAPSDWRDLTRTERLNHDFNLRERCPDFTSHFDSWEKMASEFRQEHQRFARLDLAYGPHELEKFDLFLPQEGKGPAPVCIFFHPGSWQRLDKSVFSFLARPLVERGCAMILANYPLVPAVRLGEIVDSVGRCFRWVLSNGSQLGLDTERVVLFGHSAGGHLASMLYARSSSFSPAERQRVRGVVSIGGFYDLEAVRESFLNETIGLTAEDVTSLSPILSGNLMECGLVLAIGERETGEFIAQQRRMADYVAAHDRSVEQLLLAEQDHFSLVRDLTRPKNPVVERLVTMLG